MKDKLLNDMILTVLISSSNIKQIFNYNKWLICSHCFVLRLCFVLEFSFSEKWFSATCSLTVTLFLLSFFSLISHASVLFFLPLFSLCPSLLFLLHRTLFSYLSYRNFLCIIYKPSFSDRCSKHMLRCLMIQGFTDIKILLTLLWHSLL